MNLYSLSTLWTFHFGLARTRARVIHTYILQVSLALYIMVVSSVCGEICDAEFRCNKLFVTKRKLTVYGSADSSLGRIDCKHGARSLKTSV